MAKRAAERQLRREDVEDGSSEGSAGRPATFEKASAEVLASRKIYKVQSKFAKTNEPPNTSTAPEAAAPNPFAALISGAVPGETPFGKMLGAGSAATLPAFAASVLPAISSNPFATLAASAPAPAPAPASTTQEPGAADAKPATSIFGLNVAQPLDSGIPPPADFTAIASTRPKVSLPPAEAVPRVTGEEDETRAFQVRGKLFALADQQWKERGVGVLAVNVSKIDGSARLLMRMDQTHREMLNFALFSKLVCEISNEKGVCFRGPTDTYLVKVKTPVEALQLVEAINKHKGKDSPAEAEKPAAEGEKQNTPVLETAASAPQEQ